MCPPLLLTCPPKTCLTPLYPSVTNTEKKVIHNPGTPPEYVFPPRNRARPLAQFGTPDAVCVSEVPYDTFVTDDVQTRLQTYRLPYACNMFQISGVPLDRVCATVTDLCKRGRYVFATDLKMDFYESFGESWGVFVDAVAAAAVAERVNK
jgi:hypothetical protein